MPSFGAKPSEGTGEEGKLPCCLAVAPGIPACPACPRRCARTACTSPAAAALFKASFAFEVPLVPLLLPPKLPLVVAGCVELVDPFPVPSSGPSRIWRVISVSAGPIISSRPSLSNLFARSARMRGNSKGSNMAHRLASPNEKVAALLLVEEEEYGSELLASDPEPCFSSEGTKQSGETWRCRR